MAEQIKISKKKKREQRPKPKHRHAANVKPIKKHKNKWLFRQAKKVFQKPVNKNIFSCFIKVSSFKRLY